MKYGDDMPEIAGWKWNQESTGKQATSTEGDNV
jgi:hypothetical protein